MNHIFINFIYSGFNIKLMTYKIRQIGQTGSYTQYGVTISSQFAENWSGAEVEQYESGNALILRRVV